MIITHHREKLINAIVYFANNTKYCGKTKLMKLLYYMDFRHFKQTGKSVTGLEYFAWERGPVPKSLFDELDNMRPDLKSAINVVLHEGFQEIVPKKKFNDQYFTKREMRLLEEISFLFQDSKANEISETTHLKNAPWHRTLTEKGPFQRIDYLQSIDEMGDSLSLDEAKERMEEISEMYRDFGSM